MVILMALAQGVDEVVNQMIKIDQQLRATSPLHIMSEEQKRTVLNAISKSEESLKRMREEAGRV
jgi:hypothetical protein